LINISFYIFVFDKNKRIDSFQMRLSAHYVEWAGVSMQEDWSGTFQMQLTCFYLWPYMPFI